MRQKSVCLIIYCVFIRFNESARFCRLINFYYSVDVTCMNGEICTTEMLDIYLFLCVKRRLAGTLKLPAGLG